MRLALALLGTLALGGSLAFGCGGDGEQQTSATASGSGGSSGGPPAPKAFCEGATTLLYDPLAGQVTSFPDDFFTIDDPTTPTKLRVHMVLGENIPKPPSGPTFETVFKDISTLDGFGTTAGLSLVVSGPLEPGSLPPSGAGSGKADASVVLVNLDSDAPEFVDFKWELVPEKMDDPMTTLIVSPLAPLRPKTRYGLAVTNRVTDANGTCVAPSPAMKDLLEAKATDPALARLAGKIGDLVDRLVAAKTITDPHELTSAVVFTTQHTVDDSAAIAAKIRTKAVAYTPVGPCADDPNKAYLICEGTFPADDFRVDKRAVDEATHAPQASYTIKVTTYLPKTGQPPFRTMIYGHGLNGDRSQGEQLAELAAPEGYATVAIDAVNHGDHPDPPGQLGAAVSFFGVSFNLMDPLDSVKLRDHWRQSTYDKLQLVEMLRPGVDIDGDDTPDVGVDELVYLGVSLGGIMSAELLAFAPEVKVALPIVPGARVVDIIKDGATFAPVITILKGQATDGQVARFFPVVQTVVDRGDSGAYVGHIVKDRLAGFEQAYPQVLMQMVIDDDTVPNSTNLFFARGLGVPHVGDELLPIGGIPHTATLPVSGNLDATHTGGVFQFDVVYEGTGPMTKMATHGNVAGNPVAIEQSFHFLSTYFADGKSEILDPYKTLGIKP